MSKHKIPHEWCPQWQLMQAIWQTCIPLYRVCGRISRCMQLDTLSSPRHYISALFTNVPLHSHLPFFFLPELFPYFSSRWAKKLSASFCLDCCFFRIMALRESSAPTFNSAFSSSASAASFWAWGWLKNYKINLETLNFKINGMVIFHVNLSNTCSSILTPTVSYKCLF